nr:hypothetical protein [Morchella crassipes]
MHLSSVEDRRGRCRRPPFPPFPPLASPPGSPFFGMGGGMQGGGKGAGCISPPTPFPWLRQGMQTPPSPLGGPLRGPPWVLMGTPQHSSHPAATQREGGRSPPSCIPPYGGGTLPPSSFCWGGRA